MSINELNEHRTYWQDPVKIAAYRAAIERQVTPDSIVLDLGSGTGLLGFLAARAGARRVYSVDSGAIISLVGELAAANGLADVIVPIQASSKDLILPEPVDLIIGDQIGGLAFDAGVMEYYADAVRRLGHEGTKTIPESFDLFVAPVTHPEGYDTIDFWTDDVEGFDLSAARKYAANAYHACYLGPEAVLGPGVPLTTHGAADDSTIRGAAEMTIETAGTLHGIVGYFEARMAPGVTMTNNPTSAERMKHRWQMFLPVPEAAEASASDRIELEVRATPGTYLVTWTTQITHATKNLRSSSTSSTFLGDFVTPQQLPNVRTS